MFFHFAIGISYLPHVTYTDERWCSHGYTVLLGSTGMMEWMVVNLSLEEELEVESKARLALNCPDSKEVAKLCAMLIKQNAHQSKLLSQAVGYIAGLEATIYLIHSTRPWWKRIFGHH